MDGTNQFTDVAEEQEGKSLDELIESLGSL